MEESIIPLDSIANNFHNADYRLVSYQSPADQNIPSVKFTSYPIPFFDKFLPFLDDIKNFDVYDDDIWILTYPKCGTTWAQEAIWQICNNVTLNDSGLKILERFPYLERSCMFDFHSGSMDTVRQLSRPRFIKSHLPMHLLPKQLWSKNPKIVGVLREPKDAAVSYNHHYHHMEGWIGSSEAFWKLYLEGKVVYGDYWLYMKNLWTLNTHSNVKIIHFEDMKRNLRGVLIELATFLQKPLTDEQLVSLCDHLEFKNMKNNPLLNRKDATDMRMKFNKLQESSFVFMRKGQIGSYKEEMSDEVEHLFNNKTIEELSDTRISYVED